MNIKKCDCIKNKYNIMKLDELVCKCDIIIKNILQNDDIFTLYLVLKNQYYVEQYTGYHKNRYRLFEYVDNITSKTEMIFDIHVQNFENYILIADKFKNDKHIRLLKIFQNPLTQVFTNLTEDEKCKIVEYQYAKSFASHCSNFMNRVECMTKTLN